MKEWITWTEEKEICKAIPVIGRGGRPQGHNSTGKIRYIEKSNDLRIRTRELPACNIVPQP
jgi:hypothetical protein